MRSLALALLGATALLSTGSYAQTGNPSPAGATTTQGAPKAVPASALRGQPVHDQEGQEFGRITSVLRGGNNERFVVVTARGNRQVVVPAGQLTFERNRYTVRGDKAQLSALSEYREGVGAYQPVSPNEQIRIAGGQREQGAAQQEAGAGEAARIVVQQPAPGIRVEQAEPRVSVQQPQPRVTVRQPQPEILVRQPQPTVTVDIPQPEITLRMPPPDVNVAQARPQVQVRQPQPQVEVVQPERQARVDVDRAQLQVDVQQSQKPDVQVQSSDEAPTVRYERAEPRVVVNQAQGQPKVRVEQMKPDQRAQGSDQNNRSAGGRTEAQRQAYQQRFGGDPATTGSVNSAQNQATRSVRIADIGEMDVYNRRGERLGDVDRVVMGTRDDRRYLVVSHGGFLGLGEDRVAFPLERFAVRGNDRLVIGGVTEEDIDAMDNWRNEVADYRNLGEAEQVELPVLQ